MARLLACALVLSNPTKVLSRVANRNHTWLEVLLIISAVAAVRVAGCGGRESGHWMSDSD
jgi:hypothetical protein